MSISGKEIDVFRYSGERKQYKGWVATSLERLDKGPFKYKVKARDPDSFYCFVDPTRSPNQTSVTMYYITWTGFLSDWKRGSARQ